MVAGMMVLEAKEQKARAMSLLSAAGTQGLLRSELESHGIELPALNHLYSKSKAVKSKNCIQRCGGYHYWARAAVSDEKYACALRSPWKGCDGFNIFVDGSRPPCTCAKRDAAVAEAVASPPPVPAASAHATQLDGDAAGRLASSFAGASLSEPEPLSPGEAMDDVENDPHGGQAASPYFDDDAPPLPLVQQQQQQYHAQLAAASWGGVASSAPPSPPRLFPSLNEPQDAACGSPPEDSHHSVRAVSLTPQKRAAAGALALPRPPPAAAPSSFGSAPLPHAGASSLDAAASPVAADDADDAPPFAPCMPSPPVGWLTTSGGGAMVAVTDSMLNDELRAVVAAAAAAGAPYGAPPPAAPPRPAAAPPPLLPVIEEHGSPARVACAPPPADAPRPWHRSPTTAAADEGAFGHAVACAAGPGGLVDEAALRRDARFRLSGRAEYCLRDALASGRLQRFVLAPAGGSGGGGGGGGGCGGGEAPSLLRLGPQPKLEAMIDGIFASATDANSLSVGLDALAAALEQRRANVSDLQVSNAIWLLEARNFASFDRCERRVHIVRHELWPPRAEHLLGFCGGDSVVTW